MQQILLVQETDLTPAVILVQINFCACWEPLQILVQAWNIWLILCKTYGYDICIQDVSCVTVDCDS